MATWYAQKGSCNINSVSGGTTSDVWNSAAGGGGSWLDLTADYSGDTFRSNGQTAIDININWTCDVMYGETVDGAYTISSPITLTATGTNGIYGRAAFTTVNAGYTITIAANILASGTAAKYSLIIATGVTVNITGNCTNSTSYNVQLININHASAVVTITGNITGGGSSNYGVYIQAGTLTINGNLTGGSAGTQNNCSALYALGDATATVNGTVTAGTVQTCIRGGSSVAVSVTGTIVYGTAVEPYQGRVQWNPSADSKYIEVPYSGGTYKLGKPIAAGLIIQDTVQGAVTGTYHEATVAEVQDGVMFGALSALEGTYAGGGGLPILGGSIVR